jgi:hypothetical protein
MFLGHENATTMVFEYDENLLLLLLMEANKLLMPNKVEDASNFHSQVDFEGLLHTITTTIDTYMDIVLMEFIRF